MHLLPLQPFGGVNGEQPDRVQLIVWFLSRDSSSRLFEKHQVIQEFMQRTALGNGLLLPLPHKFAEDRERIARSSEVSSSNSQAKDVNGLRNDLHRPRMLCQRTA